MSEPSLPHSIKVLNRLHVAGKYSELIEAERENLAHLRRAYDFEHKYVGTAISQLAWSLYENGDFAAAEKELLSGMIADVAGSDDFKQRNADFLHDLSNIYLATNREREADSATVQANEMLASMSAAPSNRIVNSLLYSARILMRRGEHAEAERRLKEAADLTFAENKPKDRSRGIIFHRLSELYAVQGRIADAEDVMRMALEAYPARETAYYANSFSLLGVYAAKQGRMSTGQSHLTIALEILKRVRPPGHRDIVATERRLVKIPGSIEPS